MIYVLHFDRPYHHARHYVGFAENAKHVERRVRQHIEGTGRRPSPLVRAVVAAGIGVQHVATFEGDRAAEKRIKAGASTARICPICRAEALAKARDGMRRLRAKRRAVPPTLAQERVSAPPPPADPTQPIDASWLVLARPEGMCEG